jgi:antitoxin component YwqK of YwqJK toxin-antitoxin module
LQSGIKWQPNGEICPVTNVKGGSGISVVYNEDGTEKERIYFKDGVKIETKEQGEIKADARISSDEIDKLLEDSIGESPPPLAPPPPNP